MKDFLIETYFYRSLMKKYKCSLVKDLWMIKTCFTICMNHHKILQKHILNGKEYLNKEDERGLTPFTLCLFERTHKSCGITHNKWSIFT